MSATSLKNIALILMTIDHIGLYIPGMPIAFRWIGRLSAPVFLFCVLEGIEKTGNRKKYILRLYLFSLAMAFMEAVLNAFILPEHMMDGNIFLVYCAVAAFVCILEWSQEKYHSMKRGVLYIMLWQFIAQVLIILYCVLGLPGGNDKNFPLFRVFTGYIGTWWGNTVFAFGGAILYFFKKDKKKFSACFILMSFIPSFLVQIDFFPVLVGRSMHILEYSAGLPAIFVDLLSQTVRNFIGTFFGLDAIFVINSPWTDLFEKNYQWMMIGALPVFLLYNGQRGKGHKYFYYLYYMLHILCLGVMREIL